MASDRPDWDRGVVPGDFVLEGNGVTLVSSTGTAVALRASETVKVVMIKARRANIETVYLGISSVTDDEDASTGGYQLDPGDMVTFAEVNLANVYVNGTAGDGVSYCWFD